MIRVEVVLAIPVAGVSAPTITQLTEVSGVSCASLDHQTRILRLVIEDGAPIFHIKQEVEGLLAPSKGDAADAAASRPCLVSISSKPSTSHT